MPIPPQRAPSRAVPLPPLDTAHRLPPGETIDAGGVRLHARIRNGAPGTDRTLVLVHGLGGSSTNWTDLSWLLSLRAGGIALDLPGFGRSEPHDGYSCSPREQADVVIAAIGASTTPPVDLVGNSLGGLVTILVAARRPDLVRTLTLVSPAVPDLRPDLRRVADPRIVLSYLPIVGGRARRDLALQGPEERVDAMLRLCFAEPASVPYARWEEEVTEAAARDGMPWAARALGQAAAGMFAQWLKQGDASPWHVLRRIAAPTLVIWGEADRLISARKAARTTRGLPRGRLLLLPRTGHVPQMERPEACAMAVLGMWQAVEDGTW